jgi:YesN/AraC family two-component response regulator
MYKRSKKNLLKTSKYFSAMLSGEGSKASFYRIFKKHTGYSPSEYKNRTN